ncbi:S41 family peptidase [Ferrimonas marina]|uniref:S41 family peptidase n=1 Tax=Ferrimonas marina TaxID=299255 RepID=UPI0008316B9E|nr:S41 family peptidase [Ferrimonas marina]
MSLTAWAAPAPVELDGEALLKDVDLLEQAVRALHPGLYRYLSEEELNHSLSQLRSELARGASQTDTFLALARWSAQLQCGHTYPNFWNQDEAVQAQLFDQHLSLPFTFRLQQGQMVIDQLALADSGLQQGDRVQLINQMPLTVVWSALLPLMAADGANQAARWQQLELSGYGRYEPFDVYFPLLFGAEQYRLQLVDGRQVTVAGMSREDRQAQLAPQPEVWALSFPHPQTALLRLSSFTTWNFDFDWRAFLNRAFTEISQSDAEHLVLDIRGNGGGTTEVVEVLLRYLIQQPVQLTPWQQRLRFSSVPDTLLPHLSSWQDDWRQLGQQAEPGDDGYYILPPTLGPMLTPNPNRFAGRISLLVDGANRSATLLLAQQLKQWGRATLVGRTTGGNLRGINGGQILFLRLPNSGLELDLPLIGYFGPDTAENDGLAPDIRVAASMPGEADGDLAAALAATDEAGL